MSILPAITNAFEKKLADDHRFARMEINTGLLRASGSIYRLSTTWGTVVRENNGEVVLVKQLALQLAQEIDFNSVAAGKHRDFLLHHGGWRTFYSVGGRFLTYASRNTGPRGAPRWVNQTATCMACGICLPLNMIEVDHQRPSSGGAVHAICKVLGTVGLTVGAPKGMKGFHLLRQHHNPLNVQMPQKAPKGTPIVKGVPPMAVERGSLKAARYTLTETGNALVSLLIAAEKFRDLENTCLNHFANLKPLCPACNKAKSDNETMDDAMLIDDDDRTM